MTDFLKQKELILFLVKIIHTTLRIITLYVVLTCFFIPHIFADVKPLVREIIANKKDSIFRYTYYFDDNRNKVIENKYVVKDNTPYPLTRIEWVYEGNNCISQRQQRWDNGNWKTTYIINSQFAAGKKIKETYIAVSNNIESIEKTVQKNYEHDKLMSVIHFNGDNKANDIMQKLVFTYDDTQNIKQQRIISGNPIQTDSAQVFRYVYGLTGKLDSLLLMNTVQQIETNELLTTYQYDRTTGNPAVQILKKWNAPGSKWENLTKTEFEYDHENRLVREMYYHYNILFWAPNAKYEYIYDSNGLLEEKIMYQPIYRQWRKIFTIEYSEIANGQPNLMESKYNFWGGETGTYVNNYIPYYFNDEIAIMNADRMELKYFIDTTVITNSQFESGWLKIYPNPSNGVFYINTQEYYIESWDVYNLSGIIVKSDNSRYRTGVVDLTGMPDGLYMIKARTSDNKELKQKLIINRNR